MFKVFGISNHSPKQLIDWLKSEFSIRETNISILPLGKLLPKSKSYKVSKHVIIQRYSDFDNNVKTLMSDQFKGTIFYIFASPVKLHKYNELVLSLDSHVVESTALFCHELKSELNTLMYLSYINSDVPEEVTTDFIVPTHDYVTTVIESTKDFNSILNSLMSLIYLLPSSTHQKPIKNVICSWIFKHGSDKELLDIFDIITLYAPLSDSVRDRLTKILFSSTSKLYIKAFKEYSKCSPEDEEDAIDKISTKYSISAYDMRYIRAISLTYDKYSSEVKHALEPIYKGK